jgi:hypothetical protein
MNPATPDIAHPVAHDEHHVTGVPRDPDLPTVSDTTLCFFAAGSLVVFVVALLTLIH